MRGAWELLAAFVLCMLILVTVTVADAYAENTLDVSMSLPAEDKASGFWTLSPYRFEASGTADVDAFIASDHLEGDVVCPAEPSDFPTQQGKPVVGTFDMSETWDTHFTANVPIPAGTRTLCGYLLAKNAQQDSLMDWEGTVLAVARFTFQIRDGYDPALNCGVCFEYG